MNHTLLLLSALLALPATLRPQIDCLSTTKQLKESYDHKEYSAIACSCPCDQYKARGLQSADRNQCLQCMHYHYPRPFIFLRKAVAMHAPLWEKWHKDPRQIMREFMRSYLKRAS